MGGQGQACMRVGRQTRREDESWSRRPGGEEGRGGEVIPSPSLPSAFLRLSRDTFPGWAVPVGPVWGTSGVRLLAVLSGGALLTAAPFLHQ